MDVESTSTLAFALWLEFELISVIFFFTFQIRKNEIQDGGSKMAGQMTLSGVRLP